MADRIDRIVDTVGEHTKMLLSRSASQWPAAREGLERIFADLRGRAPGHPGLRRLRRLIDDLSLIHGIGGVGE